MTDREHEQLLATATDRFERRLSEEMGAVRVTLVEQVSATRQELGKDLSDLRVEMCEQDAATRLEISKLRLDMSGQFAETRVHIEARHREMLKWTIVLWVGQAAAVAGIVSAFH